MNRSGILVVIAGAWLLGVAVVFAVPTSRKTATVLLTEPGLRPWLDQIIQRDPALAAFNWTIASSETEGPRRDESTIWLGLAPSVTRPDERLAPVAVGPYVVLVWETSLERLGQGPEGAVDWTAIQRSIANPRGPRFVLPIPGTATGDDGLLLLALANQGLRETHLGSVAPQDTTLSAWLEPFYRRQNRLRSDERILADDWVRYRGNIGDAGLLPEHTALELLPVLERQAMPLVRYPLVNKTRTYALVLPTSGEQTQVGQRLQEALLAPFAQHSLPEVGFRPIGATPPPVDGPFVTYRARGVDWHASWAEADVSAATHQWVRGWRVQ